MTFFLFGERKPKELTVQKIWESNEKQFKSLSEHFSRTVSHMTIIYPTWLPEACPTYGLHDPTPTLYCMPTTQQTQSSANSLINL